MRLHLAHTNYTPSVLEVTDRFFKSRPWRGTMVERYDKFNNWLQNAASADSIPAPRLSMVMPGLPIGGGYHDGMLWIERFSVVQLFHGYRHHVQEVSQMTEDGTECMDAQGWACSLYYIVRPEMFKSAVEHNNIYGVSAADLVDSPAPVWVPDCTLAPEEQDTFDTLADSFLETLEPDSDLAALLDEMNRDS